MANIQLNSKIQIDLNDVLNGVAHLDLIELEGFVQKVNHIFAKRKAPALSGQESELLLKINKGLDVNIQQRYNELSLKFDAETLSVEEHQELIGISDQIELKEGERLKCLIELAQLRSVSLDVVMEQLGLKPLPNA